MYAFRRLSEVREIMEPWIRERPYDSLGDLTPREYLMENSKVRGPNLAGFTTATYFLNDKVLPFFDSKNMALLRTLTDRGTEYCGRIETHPYQLFLHLMRSSILKQGCDTHKPTDQLSG
jgi:hypothetical protein